MKTLFSLLLLTGMMLGQNWAVDVPAVHVAAKSETLMHTDGEQTSWECTAHGKPTTRGRSTTTISGQIDGSYDLHCIGGWRWGCADKSAFLLQAEDGKRHCLKIGDTVPVKSEKP